MGLKFVLYHIKNAVIFEVLDQTGFNSRGIDKELQFRGGPLVVHSLTNPAVCPGNIYLRGDDKEQDNRVASYSFESSESAGRYVADVKTSLLKLVREHPDFAEKGIDYEYLVRRVLAARLRKNGCLDCPNYFLEIKGCKESPKSCADELLDWLVSEAQGKRTPRLIEVSGDTFEIKWVDRPVEECSEKH